MCEVGSAETLRELQEIQGGVLEADLPPGVAQPPYASLLGTLFIHVTADIPSANWGQGACDPS